MLRLILVFQFFKFHSVTNLEVEMQNFFVESIYLTSAKDTVYSKALREIDTIIKLINTELGTVSD